MEELVPMRVAAAAFCRERIAGAFPFLEPDSSVGSEIGRFGSFVAALVGGAIGLHSRGGLDRCAGDENGQERQYFPHASETKKNAARFAGGVWSLLMCLDQTMKTF